LFPITSCRHKKLIGISQRFFNFLLTSFYDCYYLSFRNQKIRQRFETMFKRFRNYLIEELEGYRNAGIVKAKMLDEGGQSI